MLRRGQSGSKVATLSSSTAEGVGGELPELLADPVAGGFHALLDERHRQPLPLGHARPVAPDLFALNDQWGAIPQLVEGLGADVVDEKDARSHDAHRPGVRVAPGDRRGGVDHRHHARIDEVVGRYRIEVRVVDDGDVTGAKTARQLLGPPPGSCGAADRRSLAAPWGPLEQPRTRQGKRKVTVPPSSSPGGPGPAAVARAR